MTEGVSFGRNLRFSCPLVREYGCPLSSEEIHREPYNRRQAVDYKETNREHLLIRRSFSKLFLKKGGNLLDIFCENPIFAAKDTLNSAFDVSLPKRKTDVRHVVYLDGSVFVSYFS